VSWEVFDRRAATYESWYQTPRGQRVDRAERALLDWLMDHFHGARTALEVGCGTGHFTSWLARKPLRVVGLDRAPAMLAKLREHHPAMPVVCGDAQRLPFRPGAVDVTVFVATLEFVENPSAALAEAVSVSRMGLALVVLNRWSVGGVSRRWGAQAGQPLLGRAADLTLPALRVAVRRAAGSRLRAVGWTSTLFPNGLWMGRARIPLGDVLGMAVRLAPPPVQTPTGDGRRHDREKY
jgi:SAM-dependent methyltransferase